jgi:AraC-like DNA-binding protein
MIRTKKQERSRDGVLSPLKNECSCYEYTSGEPLIEVINKNKGERFEFESKDNVIIMVLKGRFLFSSGMVTNKVVSSGTFFLHPHRYAAVFEMLENTEYIVMHLNINIHFCDQVSLMEIYDRRVGLPKQRTDIFVLPINDIVGAFISFFQKLCDGFYTCNYLFDLKIKEFFYILREYYPKADLQQFFHPILNKDLRFSEFVFENAGKVRTAKELADLFNYSFSGFEKRFKKVFGMSVNKWLQQELSRKVYHAISCSNKTIMEISFEYGFSSPSYFNDFCKRIFKETPGAIRKRHKMLP